MPVNEDDFPDTDAIGQRWRECWDVSTRVAPSTPPDKQLDQTLAVFLNMELEDDAGLHDRLALIGATLAAINNSGTHSEAAIKSAVKRMHGGMPRKLLRGVDTRIKRIALIVFPFLAIITLFRLARDMDKYDGVSLSFVLFFMASILCLLLAFTRLGDWVRAP